LFEPPRLSHLAGRPLLYKAAHAKGYILSALIRIITLRLPVARMSPPSSNPCCHFARYSGLPPHPSSFGQNVGRTVCSPPPTPYLCNSARRSQGGWAHLACSPPPTVMFCPPITAPMSCTMFRICPWHTGKNLLFPSGPSLHNLRPSLLLK